MKQFSRLGSFVSTGFGSRGHVILYFGLSCLLTWRVSAQTGGTVNFANNSFCPITNGVTHNLVTTGDNVHAALYWAPLGSSTFVQIGGTVTVGQPQAGLFMGGTRSTGQATPGGQSGQFQVRAWSGGYSTFEQALSAYGALIGSSPIFTTATGSPAGAPPMPPISISADASRLQGFKLAFNTLSSVLTANCAANKAVSCSNTTWSFDPPSGFTTCADPSATVSVISTITNSGGCAQVLTRTWWLTDNCGNLKACSQSVTVICPGCPALLVSKICPPYPVPPGGVMSFVGTITNTSNFTLTNVQVTADHPAPNTLVFGPATLAPGSAARFTNSYPIAACDCGPHTDTLTASGVDVVGNLYNNTSTTSCPGTNYVVPGDLNGDGIVDQNELNQVLANYWAHAPGIYMTNPAALANGYFQFALTNVSGWNFTVLVSTNGNTWANLTGPAAPVYQFRDPGSSNAPIRIYRLQYP